MRTKFFFFSGDQSKSSTLRVYTQQLGRSDLYCKDCYLSPPAGADINCWERKRF